MAPGMFLSHCGPEIINLNPLLRIFNASINLVHVGLYLSHPLLEYLRIIGVESECFQRNTIYLLCLFVHISAIFTNSI